MSEEKEKISIIKGNDLNFNIPPPFKTGDEFLDGILSTEGGLSSSASMMIWGPPGCGKSTISLDILSRINNTNKDIKCLYISIEMDKISYYRYVKRLWDIGELDVVFLVDLLDETRPEKIQNNIKNIFNMGYDIIAIDSITDLCGIIKDVTKFDTREINNWLIKLQNSHKEGKNPLNKPITFINIVQVTKGGNFAGSNSLKHSVDMSCTLDIDEKTLDRTMKFDKNRLSEVDYKIYYSIYNGKVHYSGQREDKKDENNNVGEETVIREVPQQ